jgi:hypothetical protein
MDPDSGIWCSARGWERFFLQELVQACTVENVPIMVGGDFNIIRSSQEKITIDTVIDGLSYLMSWLTY